MYKRILVGFDGSEAGLKAVRRGAELAVSFGAELYVVTVVPPPNVMVGPLLMPEVVETTPFLETARRRLREISDIVFKEYGIDMKHEVLEGDPTEALVRYAEERNCDLIVVGRRGLRGLERLVLGSVAQKVASRAKVDTLIVPT
ncbi:MAG: universal stress protein [Desulfurococcales archaeon]|nr:universal stress protein [Desulfurococcales archaeon]